MKIVLVPPLSSSTRHTGGLPTLGAPSSAVKGHFLDGICWFTTVFSLAMSLGLVSTAFTLVLLISRREPGSVLVPHTTASHSWGRQPPG